MNRLWIIGGSLLLLGAGPDLATRLAKNPRLVDAATVARGLLVKLRYSGTDNFLGQDLYGDLSRCYLARPAAIKLARAARLLARQRPDLRLLAYDCVRPVSVQWAMWRKVRGTPAQAYVADPRKGSIHSLGCAVDLTLADAKGRPLPMGTPFDHTGPLAQPRLERRHLRQGKLTREHVQNRRLLRRVMVRAGFRQLPIEWWHFDCMTPEKARKRLRPVR